MASYIPIIIKTEYKADAILIDDDPLIRACWELSAIEKKKVLVLFSSADEFLKVANTYDKDTTIYVDVNLSNGERGDNIAAKLSNQGFCNIYLATGYDSANFVNLPFIKGVIDKYPPF